jgi:tRNA pseudouridine38-40 synthase
VKLTVEYDGTDYAGWQRQADRPTIQQHLEEALSAQLGEEVSLVGAGRTDAGVHARAQAASFRTRSDMPVEGIWHGSNVRLPDSIAILAAEDAPGGFHAQRDATSKHYRYSILVRPVRAPLAERYALRVRGPLDVPAMREAAAGVPGRRDWSSFRNAGSVEGSAVRTVTRLDITRDGEYVLVDVEGDGFLYKMVRNLVGTLLEVGRGKRRPEELPEILEAKDRRRAGPTASPRGLTLVEVRYGT